MDETSNTLRRLIMGFRVTQLIYVAAKLGLADRLQEGPKSAEELAKLAGADPQALYRILRALASIGVFTETADAVFARTPLSDLLTTNAPGSLRGVALLYGENWLWKAYGQMLYSAQTGQPAFEQTHGRSFYEFLDDHPEEASLFQAAMSGFSAQEAAAILGAYDFSNVKTIVDVGAGHGALMASILRAHAHLSGVAFDSPATIGGAESLFADAGLASRADCVGGDFFAEVPSGGDLYLLKSVLHNWDDRAAASILETCHRAMSAEARLLVIERVIPTGNEPSEAKLFDVNMLVVVGGRERTEREYQALFEQAGFVLMRTIPTMSPMTLVEALPKLA